MRRQLQRLIPALIAGGLLVGCGSHSAHKPSSAPTPPPFTCIHKVPAQAGECIADELEAHGVTPARPNLLQLLGTSTGGHQCVDISVWQGVPNFREAGVRCAIVQTNDGSARNGLFYAQTRELRDHGIAFGCYAFLEAYSGSSQAYTSTSMCNGSGATLGEWSDAEVGGAYQQACSFNATASRAGYRIVGVYSSPGNWPGYRCQGYDWPAEWGGGGAYPLAGYSYSATVLRQFCGTCRLPGFGGEVDRDEDLGLLALVKPPPPPCNAACQRSAKRRRLGADYRVRGFLRADIVVARHRINALRVAIRLHQCAPGDHRHATPHGYRRTCNRWLKEGQREHRVGQFWTGHGRRVARDIAQLHREGIF